jgi:predicted nicotinamide N-methyase
MSGEATFAFRLEVQKVPLCPEIRLRLLSPSVNLDADARDFLGENAPFWAFCWASGQVLARWLLDHPEVVRGKRVLDFGCGSGVVAIAAALSGAASVVACDCDRAALEACRENAALNGVQLAYIVSLERIVEDCDVLLASDVLYEPPTIDALSAAACHVKLALVADPGRRPSPLERLELVWQSDARTVPDIDEQTAGAAIYRASAGTLAA